MAMFGMQGLNVVLARDLAAGDDGAHNYTVSAMQNGITVTFQGTLNIAATPVPSAITASPDPSSTLDNAKAGAQVSTVTVTMSDGSVFHGTLDVTGPE